MDFPGPSPLLPWASGLPSAFTLHLDTEPKAAVKLCPHGCTRSSQVSTRQCSALFMTEEYQVMLVQPLWVPAYYRPLRQVSKMTVPSNQDMGNKSPTLHGQGDSGYQRTGYSVRGWPEALSERKPQSRRGGPTLPWVPEPDWWSLRR